MMSEQQAQELMYQMQTLEGYFSQLTQKESSIISIIREASAAIESLKTIDDKTGGESLVPVGLGAFVKAKIAATSWNEFRTRKTTNGAVDGCQ